MQLDLLPASDAPAPVLAVVTTSNLATEGPVEADEDDASALPNGVLVKGHAADGVRRGVWLPIGSLVPGKNARGGASLDVGDLVESFRLGPQLHNIVVRPVEGTRNRYEIIAGHRRVEAQRQLGRHQVWAMVVAATDAEAEIYGLEENLRRKPIEDEVGAVARLVALHSETHSSGRGGDRKSKTYKSSFQLGQLVESGVAVVAKVTGSSAGGVRRAARIERRAVAAVREALNDGDINVNEADRLGRLPEEQQAQELATLVTNKARDRGAPVLKKIRESLDYLDSKLRKPQKDLTPEALHDFRLRATALVEVIDKLLAGEAV